jgi:hypothetical protein
MNTNDLVKALAADTLPRMAARDRLLRALPLGIGVMVAGFVLIWGVRPDIAGALRSAVVFKTLWPLLLGLLAGALALGLARPETSPRRRRNLLALLGGAVAVAFAAALVAGGVSGFSAAIATPSLAVCLVSIPVLSVPILLAMVWALSAGAPPNPRYTGAVAGLAAGGLATALYSLYCNQDAALFFLPAYCAAIAAVALAGSLIGARVLKW